MGILYYAVNDENKTAVELGKHNYPRLENRTFERIDELVHVLLLEFQEVRVDPGWNNDYAHFCALELWRAGKSFRVISDASEASLYRGYTIVGSRYISDRDRENVGMKLGDLFD